ncbi:hypothetical protein SAMN05192533_12320 [Mesobacillus persicus]|uniref:ABC-2 type transport system permease protein n=1 Tax=Mesobacillus persicus TaxID=930146 RepID=A0A1H8JYB4_9BACI|nr:hypothetical protein [Mesobacillus persicus]SEN85246.1 hypothetical protein SAMN05192533_12320 [Mesobacillus persicus]
MDHWKQAFWLVKFELKKSITAIGLLLLMAISASYFFSEFYVFYRDTGIIFYELAFLMVFGIAAIWAKPKEFQYQKINDETWGLPLFMTLSQLPIKREALINSRFLIYYFYSIPLHLLILISVYTLTPALRESMDIPSFLVFSLIWLSFGVSVGSIFPAVDAGDYITLLKSTIQTIPLFFGIVVALVLIQMGTENGIVAWTMIAATEWPFQSIVGSVLIVRLSTVFWKRKMKQKIQKVDYFS